MQQKAHAEATRPTVSYKLKPLDDIFEEDPLKKALNLGKDVDSKDKAGEIEKKPKKKKKTKKVVVKRVSKK